jgi:hypothetical protein
MRFGWICMWHPPPPATCPQRIGPECECRPIKYIYARFFGLWDDVTVGVFLLHCLAAAACVCVLLSSLEGSGNKTPPNHKYLLCPNCMHTHMRTCPERYTTCTAGSASVLLHATGRRRPSGVTDRQTCMIGETYTSPVLQVD